MANHFFARIGLAISRRVDALAEAYARHADELALGEDPSPRDPALAAAEALAASDSALSAGGYAHRGQLESDDIREADGAWLPMTSEQWSQAHDIRIEVDLRHSRVNDDGSINASHVADESSARRRAGLPQYIAALDGPGKFRPADPSLLDGATAPGPPNASKNAGQFAAAWNELTAAERDDLVLIWDERDRRASSCIMRNHQALEQLLDRSREANASLGSQLGDAEEALESSRAAHDSTLHRVAELEKRLADAETAAEHYKSEAGRLGGQNYLLREQVAELDATLADTDPTPEPETRNRIIAAPSNVGIRIATPTEAPPGLSGRLGPIAGRLPRLSPTGEAGDSGSAGE